jgi:hypothetical protein
MEAWFHGAVEPAGTVHSIHADHHGRETRSRFRWQWFEFFIWKLLYKFVAPFFQSNA